MRRFLLLVFLIAVISIFIGITSPLCADDLEGYVAFKGGIYSPEETPLKDFDNGWNGEIAFGASSGAYAAELGVGYFEFDGPGAIVIGPGPALVPAEVKISVIPVTFNVRYLYRVGGFEPYVMAGTGVYVADAELSGGGNKLSDRYTSIGVQLGLGAYFNLTKSFFLGAEAKYLWVQEHKFQMGFLTQEVSIDGYAATINVGYRFDIPE